MRNNAHLRAIQYYRTPNGRSPFIEWFESIRDENTNDGNGKLARVPN